MHLSFQLHAVNTRSWNTVTRPWDGQLGLDSWEGQEFFFYSPPHPDQLWGPPSLLSNGYQGLFWGKNGLGVTLTTHLHLVPKLRMHGAIPSLHQISSWCGTSCSSGITLLLFLTSIFLFFIIQTHLGYIKYLLYQI